MRQISAIRLLGEVTEIAGEFDEVHLVISFDHRKGTNQCRFSLMQYAMKNNSIWFATV